MDFLKPHTLDNVKMFTERDSSGNLPFALPTTHFSNKMSKVRFEGSLRPELLEVMPVPTRESSGNLPLALPTKHFSNKMSQVRFERSLRPELSEITVSSSVPTRDSTGPLPTALPTRESVSNMSQVTNERALRSEIPELPLEEDPYYQKLMDLLKSTIATEDQNVIDILGKKIVSVQKHLAINEINRRLSNCRKAWEPISPAGKEQIFASVSFIPIKFFTSRSINFHVNACYLFLELAPDESLRKSLGIYNHRLTKGYNTDSCMFHLRKAFYAASNKLARCFAIYKPRDLCSGLTYDAGCFRLRFPAIQKEIPADPLPPPPERVEKVKLNPQPESLGNKTPYKHFHSNPRLQPGDEGYQIPVPVDLPSPPPKEDWTYPHLRMSKKRIAANDEDIVFGEATSAKSNLGVEFIVNFKGYLLNKCTADDVIAPLCDMLAAPMATGNIVGGIAETFSNLKDLSSLGSMLFNALKGIKDFFGDCADFVKNHFDCIIIGACFVICLVIALVYRSKKVISIISGILAGAFALVGVSMVCGYARFSSMMEETIDWLKPHMRYPLYRNLSLPPQYRSEIAGVRKMDLQDLIKGENILHKRLPHNGHISTGLYGARGVYDRQFTEDRRAERRRQEITATVKENAKRIPNPLPQSTVTESVDRFLSRMAPIFDESNPPTNFVSEEISDDDSYPGSDDEYLSAGHFVDGPVIGNPTMLSLPGPTSNSKSERFLYSIIDYFKESFGLLALRSGLMDITNLFHAATSLQTALQFLFSLFPLFIQEKIFSICPDVALPVLFHQSGWKRIHSKMERMSKLLKEPIPAFIVEAKRILQEAELLCRVKCSEPWVAHVETSHVVPFRNALNDAVARMANISAGATPFMLYICGVPRCGKTVCAEQICHQLASSYRGHWTEFDVYTRGSDSFMEGLRNQSVIHYPELFGSTDECNQSQVEEIMSVANGGFTPKMASIEQKDVVRNIFAVVGTSNQAFPTFPGFHNNSALWARRDVMLYAYLYKGPYDFVYHPIAGDEGMEFTRTVDFDGTVSGNMNVLMSIPEQYRAACPHLRFAVINPNLAAAGANQGSLNLFQGILDHIDPRFPQTMFPDYNPKEMTYAQVLELVHYSAKVKGKQIKTMRDNHFDLSKKFFEQHYGQKIENPEKALLKEEVLLSPMYKAAIACGIAVPAVFALTSLGVSIYNYFKNKDKKKDDTAFEAGYATYATRMKKMENAIKKARLARSGPAVQSTATGKQDHDLSFATMLHKHTVRVMSGNCIMFGLMLDCQHLLVLSHLFRQATGNLVLDSDLILTFDPLSGISPTSLKVNANNMIWPRGRDDDLLIVRLHFPLQGFRSIKGYFLSADENINSLRTAQTITRFNPETVNYCGRVISLNRAVKYSNFINLSIANTVRYDTPSAEGDCGLPTWMMTHGSSKIVGIHCANNPLGMSDFCRITQDIYIHLQKPPMEFMDMQQAVATGFYTNLGFEPNVKAVVPEGFSPVGTISLHMVQATKTRLKKTPFCDINPKYPHRTEPAILDSAVIPIMEQKYSKMRHDMPAAHLKFAEIVSDKVFPRPQKLLPMYTLEQALAILPNKASVGVGWEGWKREDLIIFDPVAQTYSAHPVLAERMTKLFNLVDSGLCPPALIRPCTKDECLKLAKILARKTRTFQISPFEWLVFGTMVLGPCMTFKHNDPISTPSTVGLDPASIEWDLVFNHVVTNRNIVDLDYEAMEACSVQQLHYSYYRHCCRYYEEDVHKYIYAYIASMCRSYMLVNGAIYHRDHGNPSGMAGTTDINTYFACIYAAACFKNAYPASHPRDYLNAVKTKFNGDDTVLSVDPESGLDFGFFDCQSYLKTMNINITPAKKDEAPTNYVRQDEVTFCKKQILWSNELRAYVPFVTFHTLLDQLSYCVDDSQDGLIQCINSALQWSFFTGRNYHNGQIPDDEPRFDVQRAYFLRVVPNRDADLFTYDEIMYRFLHPRSLRPVVPEDDEITGTAVPEYRKITIAKDLLPYNEMSCVSIENSPRVESMIVVGCATRKQLDELSAYDKAVNDYEDLVEEGEEVTAHATLLASMFAGPVDVAPHNWEVEQFDLPDSGSEDGQDTSLDDYVSDDDCLYVDFPTDADFGLSLEEELETSSCLQDTNRGFMISSSTIQDNPLYIETSLYDLPLGEEEPFQYPFVENNRIFMIVPTKPLTNERIRFNLPPTAPIARLFSDFSIVWKTTSCRHFNVSGDYLIYRGQRYSITNNDHDIDDFPRLFVSTEYIHGDTSTAMVVSDAWGTAVFNGEEIIYRGCVYVIDIESDPVVGHATGNMISGLGKDLGATDSSDMHAASNPGIPSMQNVMGMMGGFEPPQIVSEVMPFLPEVLGMACSATCPQITTRNGELILPALNDQKFQVVLDDNGGRRTEAHSHHFQTMVDEMSFEYFKSRLNYLPPLSIDPTAGEGTLLATYPMSPFQQVITPNTGTGVQLSTVEFLAYLHAFWHGSQRFLFKYVAPRESTIRLFFCYWYDKAPSTAPTYDIAIEHPGVYVTFDSSTRQITLETPDINAYRWKLRPDLAVLQDAEDNPDPWNLIRNGYLYVYIATPLGGVNIPYTSNPIIQPFYSGGSDLTFHRFEPIPNLSYFWFSTSKKQENLMERSTKRRPSIDSSVIVISPPKSNPMIRRAVSGRATSGIQTLISPAPTQADPVNNKAQDTPSDNVAGTVVENAEPKVEKVADTPGAKIINMLSGPANSPVPSIQLTTLASKWFVYKTYNILPATTLIDEVSHPIDTLKAQAKLIGTTGKYFRGDLRVRIQPTVGAYSAGLGIMAWVPFGEDYGTSLNPQQIARLLTLRHVMFDLSSNDPVELFIPYQYPLEYFTMTNDNNYSGGIIIGMITPFAQPTTAPLKTTITVAMKWENFQTFIPKPIPSCVSDAVVGRATSATTNVTNLTTQKTSVTASDEHSRPAVVPLATTKIPKDPSSLMDLMHRITPVSGTVVKLAKAERAFIPLLPYPQAYKDNDGNANVADFLQKFYTMYRGDTDFTVIMSSDTNDVGFCAFSMINQRSVLATPETLVSELPIPFIEADLFPRRLGATAAARPTDSFTVNSCLPITSGIMPWNGNIRVPFYPVMRYAVSPHQQENDFPTGENITSFLVIYRPDSADDTDATVRLQIWRRPSTGARFAGFAGMPLCYFDTLTDGNASPTFTDYAQNRALPQITP